MLKYKELYPKTENFNGKFNLFSMISLDKYLDKIENLSYEVIYKTNSTLIYKLPKKHLHFYEIWDDKKPYETLNYYEILKNYIPNEIPNEIPDWLK